MGGTYCHDEGVGESSDGIGELMGKLDVMFIQPTTRDDSDTVESSNAGLRKDAGEEVTNNTTDSVGGKNLDPRIHKVVNNKELFRKRVRRERHRSQGGTLAGWRNCKQFHQARRKRPRRLRGE